MNPHLYARDVKRILDTILGRIEIALAQRDRVEPRNFDAFPIHKRRARIGRYPRTGAAVSGEKKASAHLKPIKVMQARSNGEAAVPGSEVSHLLTCKYGYYLTF